MLMIVFEAMRPALLLAALAMLASEYSGRCDKDWAVTVFAATAQIDAIRMICKQLLSTVCIVPRSARNSQFPTTVNTSCDTATPSSEIESFASPAATFGTTTFN